MHTKSKIIRLFGEAVQGEQRTDNKARLLGILIILLFILGAFTLYEFRKDLRRAITEAEARVQQAEARELKATAEVKALLAEKEKARQTRIYSGWLEIRNVRLAHINGELLVSGEIRNTGKLGFNDIELTIYCLGEEGTPLCEKTHLTSSSDGKPLERGQHRKFRFKLERAPAEAREVQIIISELDLS